MKEKKNIFLLLYMLLKFRKLIFIHLRNFSILEIHIESGTERREISIVVFDVLERWLKGNGFRQLSFPRYFQRIF